MLSICSYSFRQLTGGVASQKRFIERFRSRSKLQIGARKRDGLGKPKGYADSSIRYILESEQKSGLPKQDKPYLVLGIETSCDDTGVGIVRSDGKILANVVYSQNEIHEKFGGIVPSLAMEAHKSNIDIAVERAIKAAGLNGLQDIDAVAVTKGPGLEICLRVGMRKAQQIAVEFNKPFVAVHHLEAHCLLARLAGKQIVAENQVNDLNNNQDISTTEFKPVVEFPFLVLLASGGHTSILLCSGLGNYSVLGGTLDDALGEAFDKAARLVGLRTGGSGGAAVEQAARNGSPSAFSMTVPMRSKPNCDFSYAGYQFEFNSVLLSN